MGGTWPGGAGVSGESEVGVKGDGSGEMPAASALNSSAGGALGSPGRGAANATCTCCRHRPRGQREAGECWQLERTELSGLKCRSGVQ